MIFPKKQRGGFSFISLLVSGKNTKSKAFTLIELLVAVSIFSGVVVLTLGAFARSSDSTIRSNIVREKTEAARSVVDRIGSDFEYIYGDTEFFPNANDNCTEADDNQFGYIFTETCLFLVLRYPYTQTNELVAHRYRTFEDKVLLAEWSGCQIVSQVLTCSSNPNTESSLLGDKYIFDDDTVFFGGLLSSEAVFANEQPRIDVTVTIKPDDIENRGYSCVSATTPNPNCYTIRTSFVPNY